jgi:hypothetical protein
MLPTSRLRPLWGFLGGLVSVAVAAGVLAMAGCGSVAKSGGTGGAGGGNNNGDAAIIGTGGAGGPGTGGMSGTGGGGGGGSGGAAGGSGNKCVVGTSTVGNCVLQ